MAGKRRDVYLVCGGDYHDFDFARLELLKLLAEHDHVRVKVGNDYSDIAGMCEADLLISYTCNVVPDKAGQAALKKYVEDGGKWYALHATNSVLEWVSQDPPLLRAPRDDKDFMEVLGSQFLAHPPVDSYRVEVTDPDHPLVAGIEPFDTVDELYLSEYHGESHALLHTHFNGKVDAFQDGDWETDDPHLVCYLKQYGAGEVLYLTLGHCRSTYDMQPLVEEYPAIERCSWELPVYYELLRRGIRWGIGA
jgi:uncharacterized protein